MKTTINFSQFCDAFRDMERDKHFTFAGKQALFDYLESYEEDNGVEIELDIIGLCCDYAEYANLAELQEDYHDIENMEDLENNTIVIPIDSERFIIQQY